MKRLILIAVCLLAGCVESPESQRIHSKTPMPVAQAADGTVLWRSYDRESGKFVYFTEAEVQKVLPK